MAPEPSATPQNKVVGTAENPLVVKPEKPFEKPRDLFAWDGPARPYHNRDPVWFVGFFLIIGLLVVVLILIQQWTFALAVAALGFVLLAMNMFEPANREHAILTTGIKLGRKVYYYRDLESFWISTRSGQAILYVTTYLNYPQTLEIALPAGVSEEDRKRLENELLKYLPYQRQTNFNWNSSFDRVIEIIGPWLPKSLIDWYAQRFH